MDILLIQDNRHARVVPAFLLELADANLPDFPGRFQVGATTQTGRTLTRCDGREASMRTPLRAECLQGV